jgi:hypothetical protein
MSAISFETIRAVADLLLERGLLETIDVGKVMQQSLVTGGVLC